MSLQRTRRRRSEQLGVTVGMMERGEGSGLVYRVGGWRTALARSAALEFCESSRVREGGGAIGNAEASLSRRPLGCSPLTTNARVDFLLKLYTRCDEFTAREPAHTPDPTHTTHAPSPDSARPRRYQPSFPSH